MASNVSVEPSADEEKFRAVDERTKKVVCKNGYGRYFSKVQLFTHSWLPENTSSIKYVLYLIHGLHGHCTLFHEMASLFAQSGVGVYSHDNYGHGRSAGTKVMPPSFEVYWRDACDRIREVSALHPNLPVFAFGHSLGGLIVLDVTLELQSSLLAGTIYMAPALGKNPNVSKLSSLEFLAAPLSKLLPSLPVPTNLKVSNFTSVRNKQIENTEDPLIYHGQPKLKHVVIIAEAMSKVAAKAEKVTKPYLVVAGEKDIITPLGPIEAFNEAVPESVDKTMKVYEGMRHGLYIEKEETRRNIFQDIIAWMCTHASSTNSTATIN